MRLLDLSLIVCLFCACTFSKVKDKTLLDKEEQTEDDGKSLGNELIIDGMKRVFLKDAFHEISISFNSKSKYDSIVFFVGERDKFWNLIEETEETLKINEISENFYEGKYKVPTSKQGRYFYDFAVYCLNKNDQLEIDTMYSTAIGYFVVDKETEKEKIVMKYSNKPIHIVYSEVDSVIWSEDLNSIKNE